MWSFILALITVLIGFTLIYCIIDDEASCLGTIGLIIYGIVMLIVFWGFWDKIPKYRLYTFILSGICIVFMMIKYVYFRLKTTFQDNDKDNNVPNNMRTQEFMRTIDNHLFPKERLNTNNWEHPTQNGEGDIKNDTDQYEESSHTPLNRQYQFAKSPQRATSFNGSPEKSDNCSETNDLETNK